MLSILFLRRTQARQKENIMKQRYGEFAYTPIEEIKAKELINYCSDIKSDKKRGSQIDYLFYFCSESNSDI